jgi:starch phosphorylase
MQHLKPPVEFEIPVPSKPVIVEDINVLNLRVAYFCMEIGITNDLQFYAGGLGILAGDMLKSCADLDVPVVGISLFYRKGYMTQWLDESGWQFENMETIVPDARFVLLRERVTIEIEGRKVTVAAWLHKLKGIGGSIVPILFLDTDLPENAEQDRSITHDLYQGDHRYRIKQEAVLGIAGVRMLEKISATRIEKFHMNEGHSAFLTVELYRKVKDEESAVERVRDHAVFTTHTPVAAGHDKFDASLVHEVLGDEYIPNDLIVHATEGEGLFNMTKLGMYLSGHTNGVAKRHSEVTREMFPGYRIESITNGVYAREWISESIKQLYKKYLPDWEHDPYCLRYALSIPQEELWQAHIEAKRTLFTYVKQTTGIDMQEEVFTIGFARRATGYKRAELLWSDMERLKSIASRYPRGIQVIFAGKAHPGDHESKLMIQRIVNKMRDAGPNIKAVYLPNYNMNIAKLLVAGVDIWMNTPTRPQEASGTSGMKAALNGVPHFSVLDGWWIEGHIEHVTGWSIGPHPEEGKESSDAVDREDMYTKLEYVVLARYYQERDAWIKMMRHAIAINGSFFNTHRMVEQYVLTTYFK